MNLTEWTREEYERMTGEWLTGFLARIPESESLFRSELTPAESFKYRNGKVTMADLLPKVLGRTVNKYNREHQATLNWLLRAAGGPLPDSIEVNVQWKRSRTWGMNPHVDVTARAAGVTESAAGKASGCGYDKESTAVAEAFNQCPMLARLVLECAFSDYGGSRTNGYRFDSTGAAFEGGMGMNVIVNICGKAGVKLTHHLSGKTYDTYIFDRK